MANCAKCGREIVWAVTEKGRFIPLVRVKPVYELLLDDEHPDQPRAVPMSEDPSSGWKPRYISHFVDCPAASTFSGRGKREA